MRKFGPRETFFPYPQTQSQVSAHDSNCEKITFQLLVERLEGQINHCIDCSHLILVSFSIFTFYINLS